MEELRQEFLNEAVLTLKTLQEGLQTRAEKNLSDDFLQELFRRIHTIKGTAQTFEFKVSANLAHEIENLLHALRDHKISQNTKLCSVIEEGIGILLETLQNEKVNKENPYPQEFIDKIRNLNPEPIANLPFENFSNEIPENLLDQLSSREKDRLSANVNIGNSFYLIDVGFDFSNFDERFKEFREALSKHGEIIATTSSPNVDRSRQIGFQIFFTGKIKTAEITNIITPFTASLTFGNEISRTTHSNKLAGVLSKIVENGEKTAQSLGKQIKFQIFTDEITLTPKNLKTIYEILLHLTRNAIDHAIESPEERLSAKKDLPGKIQITVSNNEGKLFLRIEDDGRGINTKDIIEKAWQKRFVPAERILSDQEALDLIFSHGFSTSRTISEISGRGVGLDIVKDAVDKANGQIKIQTTPGQGTIFEVYLPQ